MGDFQENAALLRKGYEAIAAGDPGPVVGMFASDGVLHANVDGPLGGDHRGHAAIGQFLGNLFEWTGATLRIDVEEIFADDDHGVVLVRESATRARDGVALDVRETHLCRFENGLVADFWDIPAPSQKAVHDAFFSEAQ